MAAGMSEAILEELLQRFGFVPNLLAAMSESPEVLYFYLAGQEIMAKSSLSPSELEAVQITISQYNGCRYCVAEHGDGARAAGISKADIVALQAGEIPGDYGLATVVQAARLILEKRGQLSSDNLELLGGLGIGKRKIYDIIGVIALSTVTNYIDHIAQSDVDPQYMG